MTASSTPAAAVNSSKLSRRALPWIAGAVVLAAVAGLIVSNALWPYRYRNVEPLLENVLASKIKIDHYRRTYFPHPGFVATGLTLRRNSTPDVPPFGTAEELHVQGEWNDFLLLHRSVPLVYIKGLHIVIPPVGSRANHEDFPPGSSMDFAGPTTPVEVLHLRDAEFDVQRTNGGQYNYPIHDLVVKNLQRGNAVLYALDMGNALPTGHILSHGSFGPLKPQALGDTPLSGEFTFSNVALKDTGGISGVLSSYGSFHGTIASIAAGITTTVPDFAVGRGRPVALGGWVRGSVNGLNGDVTLQDIVLKTGATTVEAQGRVVALKKDEPKTTDIDLVVKGGRAEDVLRPFIHGNVPILGAASLHGHAHVEPAQKGRRFLERLSMNGTFEVPAERLTDRKTENTLSAFSERAQRGGDKTAEADVFSSLSGPVTIRDGVASSERLRFALPGADTDLNGTFDLHTGTVHFVGDLRMQSDISHVTTGWKSFLLKPLIPFFRGKKAGAVIPIAITGSPGAYKVGQNLMHKK